MNIVLFGIKGVGKTTVGKSLAKKIGRPFIDTDQLIETLYAIHFQETLNCRQIYQKMGPLVFRSLEHAVINTLKNTQRSVIAVGGGAFLFLQNVAILKKNNHLIHLTCDFHTLKTRIFSQSSLPPFIDPQAPESSFNRVYAQRKRFYHTLQTQTVDVRYLDPLKNLIH